MAAERGDVDVMKVLIEGGADVNTQNKVISCIEAYITSDSEHVVMSVIWLSSFLNILTLLRIILEHRITLRGAGCLPSSLQHSYSILY